MPGTALWGPPPPPGLSTPSAHCGHGGMALCALLRCPRPPGLQLSTGPTVEPVAPVSHTSVAMATPPSNRDSPEQTQAGAPTLEGLQDDSGVVVGYDVSVAVLRFVGLQV